LQLLLLTSLWLLSFVFFVRIGIILRPAARSEDSTRVSKKGNSYLLFLCSGGKNKKAAMQVYPPARSLNIALRR